MNWIETRYPKWVLKHRWLIILFSLTFVFLAASGGRLITFTTNYRVFFSSDNPELLAFESLENVYTKNDNVLFVLEPKDGKVFTRKTLALVKELTEKAWQVPYSSRVDSITNFQYTEAEEDDLSVHDLVENTDSLSETELEHIKEITLHEPLLIRRLISDKADVTAINITVQLPGKNEAKETPEIVTFVRAMADEVRQNNPNINVYLTGMIMMNNSFSESAKNDMQTIVPVSFAAMLLLLALFAGGFFGTLSTLLVILFSIVSAMGIGAYMGMPLSPPSSTSPTIILTIAIANCVHILVSFRLGMRQGLEKQAALIESLRINLQPVFLACFTTTLGFLTMNFSDVPPFGHLGNFVSIGVIISFFLSVTLLPALISLLPVKKPKEIGSKDIIMSRLGDFVVKYRTHLLWGITALVVLLVSALPRNELNDVFVNYFDESIQFRTDTDFTTNHLTGTYNIAYSLDSGEPGGISNPVFMNEVAAFADWYLEQPETLHVDTYTDIMKRLNKNMHGDDQKMYRLPDQRDLSAQYLLLYEMSLPYGLDLNNQINIDKSATRFIATLKTLSSNDLINLENRAQNWLTQNAPDIKQAKGTGTSIMFAHIGKRNIKSMLLGTFVALVMISLALLIAMRSFKIGIISLIPNLTPAAMGFGLWGLTVSEIGLALSVVASMTLGIVVDDTVHFLSKYLRARREMSLDPQNAVRYAFRTVGRALVITSILLVVGFLILSTSSFELNSGMGLLTAIVIAFALLADLLFLPPLLMKFEESTNAKTIGITATDTIT